jgi:hypothetical protein
MKKKIILDLCGGSGAWSRPYKDAGYDVRNITLPDYDVMTYRPPENVYGILSAPPCDMFSFARTTAKTPRDLQKGLKIVNACLKIIQKCQKEKGYKTTLKFWVLENPNGFLKYFLGKPVYQFHPYDFNDDYSKLTHLWGWFNPPEKLILLSPHKKKSICRIARDKNIRAITPPNFAKAFFIANQ